MNLSKLKIGSSLVIANELYHGKVVGITFEPAKSNFKKIVQQHYEGKKIDLVLDPEPGNKFDKNAVAVIANGLKVGYIPKESNSQIVNFMKKHDNHYSGLHVSLIDFNTAKPGEIVGMEIHVAA